MKSIYKKQDSPQNIVVDFGTDLDLSVWLYSNSRFSQIDMLALNVAS